MLELTNILKRIVSPEVSRIRTSFTKLCKDVTETDYTEIGTGKSRLLRALCVCVCVCAYVRACKLAYGNSLLIKIAGSNISQ